uniref:transposase n=1 Tax=uncultured Tessaracoccus sp. TaxID=905023 RepID=UPI00261CB418
AQPPPRSHADLESTKPSAAPSGNTDYHRLNRTGDRTLNSAIYRIAHTRIQHDPTTKTYYDKRAAMGHSHRHILRNLKRYITRQLFRHLTNNPPQLTWQNP